MRPRSLLPRVLPRRIPKPAQSRWRMHSPLFATLRPSTVVRTSAHRAVGLRDDGSARRDALRAAAPVLQDAHRLRPGASSGRLSTPCRRSPRTCRRRTGSGTTCEQWPSRIRELPAATSTRSTASCRCYRALGPRLHAAAAAGPLPAQLPAQLPAHAAANTPVPAPVPAPVPTPIAHARTHARTKATGAAGAVGGGGAGGARMLSGGASRAAEQRREPAATPASRMPASGHPPDFGRRGCRIDRAQAKSILSALGGSSRAERGNGAGRRQRRRRPSVRLFMRREGSG